MSPDDLTGEVVSAIRERVRQYGSPLTIDPHRAVSSTDGRPLLSTNFENCTGMVMLSGGVGAFAHFHPGYVGDTEHPRRDLRLRTSAINATATWLHEQVAGGSGPIDLVTFGNNDPHPRASNVRDNLRQHVASLPSAVRETDLRTPLDSTSEDRVRAHIGTGLLFPGDGTLYLVHKALTDAFLEAVGPWTPMHEGDAIDEGGPTLLYRTEAEASPLRPPPSAPIGDEDSEDERPARRYDSDSDLDEVKDEDPEIAARREARRMLAELEIERDDRDAARQAQREADRREAEPLVAAIRERLAEMRQRGRPVELSEGWERLPPYGLRHILRAFRPRPPPDNGNT